MDNSLKLVEDDFSKEEHDKFNTDLQALSDNASSDASVQLSLLDNIISQLGNRKNTRLIYMYDISKLFENNSGLRSVLLECVHKGHFNDMRRLEILRAVPEVRRYKFPCRCTGPAPMAWTCQYHGNYHRIMLNGINAMERNQDIANNIQLIQSSGSGKSRLVDEMAKLVFTIPMNIRNPAERYGRAYPPADDHVWQYLCEKELQRDEAISRTALFFTNLFYQVSAAVERVFLQKRDLSPGELALEWRKHLSDHLGTYRDRLYKGAIEACRDADTLALSSGTYREQLIYQTQFLLNTLKKFCRFPSPEDVRIVLYFDEAHELDKRIINGNCTLYDIMWSTLHWFRSVHVFTVFISTTPYLCLSTSSESFDASQSDQCNTPGDSVAPLTETPFDCHPSFPLSLGLHGLADVGDIQFLVRFGRPLFWTMLENDQLDCVTNTLLDDMMRLARAKLLLSHAIDDPERHTPAAKLAILDVSITIDYEPRHPEARQLQMDMVWSHMRTAFTIPCDRSYIRSGYPSEPFLAEAASRQMHCYLKKYVNMIALLNSHSMLIDASRKGEMIMRLLLREAYINAVVAEQEVKNDMSPNFSRGCSFVGFLKALFAAPFHGLVLQCRPDHKVASPSTLEDAFGDAVVRFTHFVKVADGSSVTTQGMAMGFLRGAAFIYQDILLNDRIDVAIPILLNKDDKIEETSMSTLLIQVKWGCDVRSVGRGAVDANRLEFFPACSTNDSRPYVTLVAQLTVGASPSETYERASWSDASDATHDQHQHPRYSIRTYECTPEAFRVIQQYKRNIYNKMLSTSALLPEYRRHDDVSLEGVGRMLPFWTRDSTWCSDVGRQPAGRQHAPVEVGVYEENEEERRRASVRRLSRHLDMTSDLALLSPLTGSEESGSDDDMVDEE